VQPISTAANSLFEDAVRRGDVEALAVIADTEHVDRGGTIAARGPEARRGVVSAMRAARRR
jgi:hypothetical protein